MLEYDLNIGDSGTIMFRAYTDAKTSNQYFFEARNKAKTRLGLYKDSNDMLCLDLDGTIVTTGLKFTVGAWHTVGISYDTEDPNYIVGSHSSRIALKSKEEISILYSDNKYVSLIKHDVFLSLEIRTYAGRLYRKENLILQNQLLYYPMMLKLFALMNILGTNINQIHDSVLNGLFLNIWQKALGVFAMIDYGTLDNGYTMARGMIESYVTLITLYYFPNAKKKYNKFTEYKIDKLSQDIYSDEFLALYNKIDTKQVTINDYLNYGWYDDIIEFLYMQKNVRYTFSSMFRLHEMKNTVFDSSLLETLYKRCHGFVHGNAIISKFPIICYIELSEMLYLCLVPLCKILNIKAEVNSVDLIKELDDEYKNITNLKEKTLEINLDDFYNEKYKR